MSIIEKKFSESLALGNELSIDNSVMELPHYIDHTKIQRLTKINFPFTILIFFCLLECNECLNGTILR